MAENPTPVTPREMLERLVDSVTRGDHTLRDVYRQARTYLETTPAAADQEPVAIPAPVVVRDIQPGSGDDALADALAVRLGTSGLTTMPYDFRKNLAEKLIPDVRKAQALELLDMAKGFRADAEALGSSFTARSLISVAEICEARAAELHPA